MHTEAFPHSLSCSLVQMIRFLVIYFRVFIEIFEFQMYIQGQVDIRSYGLLRRAFPQG